MFLGHRSRNDYVIEQRVIVVMGKDRSLVFVAGES